MMIPLKIMQTIGAITSARKIRLLHPVNWFVTLPLCAIVCTTHLSKILGKALVDVWKTRKEFTLW